MFYKQLLQFFFRKKEENVLNQILKSYPQISFPPLLSAFVDIINLSELQSEEQKTRFILKSPSENMKLSSGTLILEKQAVDGFDGK